MVAERNLLIPLSETARCKEAIVGGKAAKLSQLAQAGYRVPDGFCVTASAYEVFLQESRIEDAIRMELGRKSLDEMRWEEIWDTALRIRSLFLAKPLSLEFRSMLESAMRKLGPSKALAVRSSALGEDSATRSFAGLHESVIGVTGEKALGDAIRLVWSSLWSDAALLYRRELGLDSAHSRMAVLVQELVEADCSGVAFGRDPRDMSKEHAIVEAVPGQCSALVDGMVDPDRWEMHRESRRVVTWIPGKREEGRAGAPLLESGDLKRILDSVLSLEELFQWAPDVEWTGRSSALTILQARPITTATDDPDDERNWYLTLRPRDERLRKLRDRVSGELIPQLEAEGQQYAAEDLDKYQDSQLADAIEERKRSLEKWKQIYWDEFIPFAHGVRRLATYYNDAVQPEDPYEFVGLLRDQPLLAAQRNEAIRALARQLLNNERLRQTLRELLETTTETLRLETLRERLRGIRGAEEFLQGFEDVNQRFLDITCEHERLQDQPETLLRIIEELSNLPVESASATTAPARTVSEFEERLLQAVGEKRRKEALEWIETGRVSWKLRDDDNLLVARIESQLLRALEVATKRLGSAGRVSGRQRPGVEDLDAIVCALRDSAVGPVVLEAKPESARSASSVSKKKAETPRQLIGQPASPGLATGTVRCVRGSQDFGLFRHGEVLVCDAIQPAMTHLVPLASAVVERRGGMLIHGAIIARELGIPCVNGVRGAADVLTNGQVVSVDGHLGIVTVGEPEFDLEWGAGWRHRERLSQFLQMSKVTLQATIKGKVRILAVVFGDQLNLGARLLRELDPQEDAVLMMEVSGEATHVPSHKQRTVLFLSAMRHFALELIARGFRVRYIKLEARANTQTFTGEMKRSVQTLRPQKLALTHPGEWRVWQMTKTWEREFGLPVEVYPDEHFTATPEEFSCWADARKELIMEYFYREQRKKLGILLNANGKPVGGKWNYDKENRQPFKEVPRPPKRYASRLDDTTKEVIRVVEKNLPSAPGKIESFCWPVTRGQAKRSLADFIDNRLEHFGRYQDAMWVGEPWLYHSTISPCLNLKLLTVKECVEAATNSLERGKAPLNSVEGFIRQLIGWREFVRCVYWHEGRRYGDRNSLEQHGSLPEFYWTGETDLVCLRESLGQVIEHGYGHHIQRLMVTGNFALISGIHPRAITDWYLGMYVDAVDWVTTPNTVGMVMHADGGVVGTKPYAASGRYVQRMSNYCQSCRFDPAKRLGEGARAGAGAACPFTTFYWDFLVRNHARFRTNRRMTMVLKNIERMRKAEVIEIQERAKRLRKEYGIGSVDKRKAKKKAKS